MADKCPYCKELRNAIGACLTRIEELDAVCQEAMFALDKIVKSFPDEVPDGELEGGFTIPGEAIETGRAMVEKLKEQADA